MRRKTNQRTFRSLTLAEIAARAGVSVPTISRVLNNRPGVAPETRERVEQILQESGFVPSWDMDILRRGSSGIVDIVVPGLDTPYSVEIVRGVSEVLERTGWRLALSTTSNMLQREQQWLGKVLEGATDGAILVLSHEQSRNLAELHRRKLPFVVVDHEGGLGTDIPSVSATHWAGGRAATEYLLSLGHRHIAVIGGDPTFRCSIDRIAGYRAALEEAEVSISSEYIRPGAFMPQTGYEQTCALLDLPEPPTAIFAGSDLQATGIYSALRARGIAIPDAMSVVGFDDIPLASGITPALTTVRQPLMEMGRVATAMLLRLIAAKPLDHPRIELATTLIVRESCAPLR
ncbi:MAG TPA: LacI family DNA-binding transcriptional regulator [Ktedonobacteraceae bacterium]